MPIFIKKEKKEEVPDKDLESFSNVEEKVIDNSGVDNRGDMDMFQTLDNKEEEVSRVQNSFSNVDTSMDGPNFTDVETTITNEKGEEYTFVDNTGKTGEDIKNPIYNGKNAFQDKQVSGNVLACLLVFFEVFFSPGVSIVKNTKKYVSGKKSIKVFIHIIIFLLLLSIAGRIIGGCFISKYIASKRDYGRVLDFSYIGKLDYLNIVVLSLVFSFGIVMLVTVINYLTSFFSSKGLSFDTYLLINVLSIVPFTIGVNVLFPIVSVISIHIAVVLVILSIVYTLLIYVNAIDEIMEFKTTNREVFYLLFNFAIMIIGTYVLLFFFFENNLNDLFNAIKNL